MLSKLCIKVATPRQIKVKTQIKKRSYHLSATKSKYELPTDIKFQVDLPNPTKLFECDKKYKMNEIMIALANTQVRCMLLDKYMTNLMESLILIEMHVINNRKLAQSLFCVGPDHDKVSDWLEEHIPSHFKRHHYYEVCPPFIYKGDNIFEYNKCIAQYISSHEKKEFQQIVYKMYRGKHLQSNVDFYVKQLEKLTQIKKVIIAE